MGVPKPLSRAQVPEELHGLYDSLQKSFGRVPNIFGVMARRPGALKTLIPFYTSVITEGTVGARYKELAYLKTSMVNGCEY